MAKRKSRDGKNGINRREFLKTAGAIAAVAAGPSSIWAQDKFELEEKSIADLRSFTSEQLCQKYIDRIREIDEKIKSVIELNPEALDIAKKLDQNRKNLKTIPPLYGIPVLIKDNIDTADKMMTTAGSLALVGPAPKTDSWVAAKLRQAGAVILGKTNLSEWANFRGFKSTSGWSARGGQTRNPYILDRNPCGSSSGSGAAVSANLCAVAVGTETDGSILCPSNMNGVVGLKPTVGLISRAGIVPISHSQDTAGPMTRTVTDAAILLGVLAGVDPKDRATSGAKIQKDYTSFLDKDGLRGVKLGVPRRVFQTRGDASEVLRVFDEALAILKSLGATIVDPAEIPNVEQLGRIEMEILQTEFKADLNAYLATRTGVPVKTLQDVIDFNEKNRDKELQHFGQELLTASQKKGDLNSAPYRQALDSVRKLARAEGIDQALAQHKVDAFVAPTGGPAWKTDYANGDAYLLGSSRPAAVAGYPSITVPMGTIGGRPVGISFFGAAWTEGPLIRMAYAFEQKSNARRAPTFQER
jgi:amidase